MSHEPSQEYLDRDAALKARIAQPFTGAVVKSLALAASLVALGYILDVSYYVNVAFFREQYFGLLYGLVFAAGFLTLPATRGQTGRPVPWFDWVLAAAGLAVGLYILIVWQDIVVMPGLLTPAKTVMGSIAIVLVLELTRRAFGWPLVAVSVLFMAYALFNFLIPGPFGGRGTSWPRLATFLYTDTNSILGLIAAVVFGLVFAFILLGRALFVTGGAAVFTDLSMAMMGGRRGGPAKVAVVASSLFGTLSGSASSNVVITGTITIPLMIATGYRRPVAAAVEAVSSTGGSILPPIMGATAFIMAEFLAVPYREVVIAALVPALLYYLTLFLQVDLEAARGGLKGLAADRLPRLMEVARRGWIFAVPLGVLIYCLFVLYMSPSKSALLAVAAVIVVSMTGAQRFTLRHVVATLHDTGLLLVEMGIIGAVAGIVVGVISLTGLGLLFSQMLLSLSGGQLFPLLLMTALASIVLGMSMPVTASYVILAVLAAPAIEGAGVAPLAAHLFIFYFAALSFITPPVCVAVYIASTIARSKPMETAMHAMKLAVVAYIVPFVFIYDQELLMVGTAGEIALTVTAVTMGFIGLSYALQGYMMQRIGPAFRLALGAASLTAFVPGTVTSVAGLVAVSALIALKLALAAPRLTARPGAGQ